MPLQRVNLQACRIANIDVCYRDSFVPSKFHLPRFANVEILFEQFIGLESKY